MSKTKNLNVIIMAAGKGKRMLSKTPKVLHKLLEEPMIYYVLESVRKIGPDKIFVITGHQSEKVEGYIKDSFPEVSLVFQERQLGTADAVRCCMDYLDMGAKSTLVLSGDIPLISAGTLGSLISFHNQEDADLSLVSAKLEDPFGYGRILRDAGGNLLKVIEEADASDEQKDIKEINTSIYCFRTALLSEYISRIKPDNTQNEYYLTDIVEHFVKGQKKASIFMIEDSLEISGINDRYQLNKAEKGLQHKVNRKWMEKGITIRDMGSVYIGPRVILSPDTIIEPNTYIYGSSRIEEDCHIGPSVQIYDSLIQKGTVIDTAKIVQANIGPYNNIGPFTYIRPQTVTAQKVKIGGFCEVKKSDIGDGSKVPHLSYIGDTEIGKGSI
jgi:bifunctional UDP-N-acetylglucosamine pyrophosphorylase / glucosamine-1-phosphate N-acetyltransferase